MIIFLNQQPVFTLATASHTNEVPSSFEPLSLKHEGKMTFLQSAVRIFFGLPSLPVPEHNRATAILTLRYNPFKTPVVEWMVLGSYGAALVGGIQAWALCNS